MNKHNAKKIRLFLTWLFVASLLLNVQSAYSCTIMPDMPDMPEPVHECCLARLESKLAELTDADNLNNLGNESCFSLKMSLQIKTSPESDADPGNDHALVKKDKQEFHDQSLIIAWMILAVLNNTQDSGLQLFSATDLPEHPPLPIYQATQRYRI